MKRLYIPLILFLLVVLEGVALDLLPNSLINNGLLIAPHWVFAYLVLVAIFFDTDYSYTSVLYAIVFGFLIDVVYTGVLGVYMFSYAVSIYIIHRLVKFLHSNILSTSLFHVIGIIIVDLSIYIIFSTIGMVLVDWNAYFLNRLIPTILANLLFLVIIYPIFTKQLIRLKNYKLNRSKII